jgi:glycosyltransferase involved in cell wall biosynthesis
MTAPPREDVLAAVPPRYVERVGVSVVLPCYNEADNIQAAYTSIVDSLSEYDLELVFIDDGSTDGTLSTIRRLADVDPRVRYLSFTRNFGFEAAFSAGFRYSTKPWALQLDIDMQFPAGEAAKLIDRALEGYDAVYGVRLHRFDPLVRKWASTAYHVVGGRMLGIRIPPGATTFRVIRTALAARIVDLRLATPYFMATVPQLTSRYTTVPVSHRPRLHGRSKFRLHRLASHALDLYFGFSTRLRALAIFLLVVAAGCCAVLAAVALVGMPPGRTVVGLASAASACTLVSLAIFGRYTMMTYATAQRGPLFCVREANCAVADSDVLAPHPIDAKAS